MLAFTCLYFLENAYLYIIEIKCDELPEDALASDKYKWLRIDKETLKITQLTFKPMDSSEVVEERYFEEGFLKFNNSDGTYIEKYNSAQHPLYKRNNFVLSTLLLNAISDFLQRI